jgi:uracil-DNA glycosylase
VALVFDESTRSRHTPLNTVKAVILGQDPYHNHNQAHGLCFSVRPPTPAPPSLKNMYIALKNDYPSFTPPPKNGGLLTPWAEQGVLMLNTCLTVRAHEAGSHANKGWERFTQKVIDTVAKVRTRGVVFLAWGTPAAKRVAKINKAKHLVLQSVHPSPLSAQKGFFTCGHFKKTNEWLAGRYGVDGVIDWNLDKPNPIAAPATTKPIKATETPKDAEKKDDPNTEPLDNFDDEEDRDAIEALEAIANSSANGDTVKESV